MLSSEAGWVAFFDPWWGAAITCDFSAPPKNWLIVPHRSFSVSPVIKYENPRGPHPVSLSISSSERLRSCSYVLWCARAEQTFLAPIPPSRRKLENTDILRESPRAEWCCEFLHDKGIWLNPIPYTLILTY